ncbi:MAG: L,D-transpeptidase family protein [Legionella sp.]|nr:L,D-transpeptidase family protein [Legionella sp.]
MQKKLKHLFLISGCFLLVNTYATTLVLPSSGDLVGEVQYVAAEPNETLDELSKRLSIGYSELLRANPNVDPAQSLSENTQLIIPSQFILPDVPRKGIVINLADYRLYYFPANENVVVTFPVGIGREGWKTPLGLTKIISKEANPKWRPTANVQAEAMKNGDSLPDEFPSGPNNPLGKYALRLGWATILIHGTNNPNGIGSRVSAGCIRMFPEDIEHLFSLVSVGTPVRVINEPVKIGRQGGSLFLQIHPLLIEQRHQSLKIMVSNKLKRLQVAQGSQNKVIRSELAYPSGLVKKI